MKIFCIAVTLFFSLALVFSIATGEDYVFVDKWGSQGSGDGQFIFPYSIAVDSTGNIYVVDTNNYRVQKFSLTGTFIAKWGGVKGSGNGEFNNPRGIAVDSSGDVYVVDTGNNRIQKFLSDGTFVESWGSKSPSETGEPPDGTFSAPLGITIDSSGNIYVADTNNNRIQKFSSDGTFLMKWGTGGINDGEFSKPGDIAVDSSGNVYVADTSNNRIQKFDSDGNFDSKWDFNGSEDWDFLSPGGIAVDSSGSVYILDTGYNLVEKFLAEGSFITSFGGYGTGTLDNPNDGKFFIPYGIAVSDSGLVFVADTSNHRIQVFESVTTTTSTTTSSTSSTISTTTTVTATSTTTSTTQPPETCSENPKILSLVKAKGTYGNNVVIKGTGFCDEEGGVAFTKSDKINAQILSWSDKKIKAAVPWGCKVGKNTVEVITASLSESNSKQFRFKKPTPKIKKLNKKRGGIGSILIIKGINFGEKDENSIVYFKNVIAEISDWNNKKITVSVPDINVKKKLENVVIKVTTFYGNSNGKSFKVSK